MNSDIDIYHDIDIPDGFYVPEYLHSFNEDYLYPSVCWEAKNQMYIFNMNKYKWFVFVLPFESIDDFADYYEKVFGIKINEVSKCWLYKYKDIVISFLNKPEDVPENAELIGEFFCYINTIKIQIKKK